MDHDDAERLPAAGPAGRQRLTRLAGELAELARVAPARLTERIAALSARDQAELILRLPAAERLELMLHAPQPMRVVRSLPDSELYLTVRELGPTDALPLLSLASASQIQHLVDLESWRRDRFDADRSGAWVALLLEAGEPTLQRFLRTADDEMLALLFQRWARVESIETEDGVEVHGSGRTEFGDERGTMSPDGFHRFAPTIAEHAVALQRIAQVFFQYQPQRYMQALWSAQTELPAELEEQSLHWRQSRLEEHGFPPWEEALSLFAPPTGLSTRPSVGAEADPASPAPRLALRVLDAADPLAAAIDELPDALRERVLAELVAIANRLVVADGADTGDPAGHVEALRTGAGYVRIALELRAARGGQPDGAALAETPAIELFREGHARAVELQVRARRLVEQGWPARHPLAIELLDVPLGEQLRALVERRPRYFDPAQPAQLPRGFRSLAEIEAAGASVEMAERIGELLIERLGLDVERGLGSTAATLRRPPTLGTFLLTVLAWHATRGELLAEPLPADVAGDFLRSVASRRTAPDEAPATALDALARTLEMRLALAPRDVAVLRAFGRAALERLAAECADLDPALPLDPARVSCLLLAATPHS